MDYEKPTERPEIGVFYGFDHMTFWVGNAKQAASYYCARMGFEYCAYQGLETGTRDFCTHVVRNGRVVFALKSPLQPDGHEEFDHHHK
jgi:4-hydroxyphenylpyruvate dioxygenase